MRYFGYMILLAMGAVAAASPARADHARYAPVFTIDAEDARARMARGGVAPVDLRPEADFRNGRLPGALPLATLVSRVDEVAPAGVIVLCGDGPNERLFGAYHFIRARRVGDVYVLDGGVDGWRRLGYPLER